MNMDLKNKLLAEIRGIVTELGAKAYIADYIFSFIHRKGINDISDMTTLGKGLRAELVGLGYYVSSLKTLEKFTAPDGTAKYLFELHDGCRIEAVLMSYENRKTVCISTQVGCRMACKFCATAKIKFKRDLTAAEIVDQVYSIASKEENIKNVVYMGMGEPLCNYDNVIKSVRILNSSKGLNKAIRHITVSTCGVACGIRKLADEDIKPRLAVSINFTDDVLRSEMMPVNKTYPLGELFKAVKVYQKKTRQRITFEYILIKDINDSETDAINLARKLNGIKCNVNLIEYNEHPKSSLKAADKLTVDIFARIMNEHGIETVIRRRKGRSIKAACGQLGSDWQN